MKIRTRRFWIKLRKFFIKDSATIRNFKTMINSNENENGKNETN